MAAAARSPEDAAKERDRNRNLLHDLKRDHDTMKQAVEQIRQEAIAINELKETCARQNRELDQFKSQQGALTQRVEAMERESKVFQQENKRLKDEIEKEKKRLDQADQKMGQIGKKADETGRKADEANKKAQESGKKADESGKKAEESRKKAEEVGKKAGEIDKIKGDVTKAIEGAKEATGAKSKLQEHQKDIQKLKEGTQSSDEMVSLKNKAELTHVEFQDLRKQIYAKGLLAPAKPEIVDEALPPVGALALREDIFAARLLIRLSFMKARIDEKMEAEDSGTDGEGGRYTDRRSLILTPRSNPSDSDSSGAGADHSQFSNVSGIQTLEVEEGGPGYGPITSGWVTVCIITLVMQFVILGMVMKSTMDGASCMKEEPAPLFWWLLHTTRFLAMIVAGSLMVRDIMDIVNYWMVSWLLEAKASCEVMFSAVARLMFTGVLVSCNTFVLISMTDPGGIWMNMSALAFVSTFGEDALDLARKGVMGHHLAKTMTELNFELNFLSEYPAFFPYVRGMTQMCSLGMIAFLAVFVFMMEDEIC